MLNPSGTRLCSSAVQYSKVKRVFSTAPPKVVLVLCYAADQDFAGFPTKGILIVLEMPLRNMECDIARKCCSVPIVK